MACSAIKRSQCKVPLTVLFRYIRRRETAAVSATSGTRGGAFENLKKIGNLISAPTHQQIQMLGGLKSSGYEIHCFRVSWGV